MKRVAWTTGMSLSNQHLQHAEQYWAWQQRARERIRAPWGWGVHEVVFDEAALSVGQVCVLTLRAIFQDGTYVEVTQHDAPLVTNIKKPGLVYVHWSGNDTVAGVNDYPSGKDAGWLGHYEYVCDCYDGYREEQCCLLSPTLTLSIGEQPSQGYFFAIGEIAEQNIYQINPNFIGPCASVSASPALLRFAERMLLRLKDTIETLHALRDRYAGQSVYEKCMYLSMFLSRTYACLQLGRCVHPVELYSACAEILSVLQAYKQKEVTCMAYDHANCGELFFRLENYISNELEHLFPSGYQAIALEDIGKSLFIVRDIDQPCLEKASFVLGLKLHATGEAEAINDQIKVADATRVSGLVNCALPGLSLRKIQQFPHDLMIKPGFDYFYIEKNGSLWNAVVEERSLAIFLPEKFHNAQIELLMMME